MTADNT